MSGRRATGEVDLELEGATGSAPSLAGPTGCLYLVGTPIGNLEDITLRALRILREADQIAAEDTRHTQKLLQHYQISRPLVSYHDHNDITRAPDLRVRGGCSGDIG